MGRPDPITTGLIDSSGLLGIVTGDPDFEVLHSFLAKVDAGTIKLIESTIVLAEVLPSHPTDSPHQALVRESLRALLESPATDLIDVSTLVTSKAGELAATYGLKPMDSIHLATAIIAQVDVLIVRDGKFPEGDVEGVWVTLPFDIDDDKLPIDV